MKKMKNIFYSLLSAFVFAVLLSACEDFNDQFEGLDDKTQITNLAKYNYTLTEANYTTISDAAVKVATTPEEISLATSIKTNKYFTTAVPASTYVPFLLKTQYPYADLGSTAMVTYAFNEARPSYLEDFVNASAYTLNNVDYATSGSNAAGFYPDVNPANYLADILATNVSSPTDGKIVLAKYSQYTEVPSVTTVSNYLLEENFNFGLTAGNLTTINSDWTAHSGTSGFVGYATSSLSMAGYPSTGLGGSAIIAGSGSEDINRTFTPQTTGTVYMSALMNFSAVGTGTYFFHFMNDGTGYTARVDTKDNGSGKILFGIGASSGAAYLTYGTTPYELNTTYLVVASYNIDNGVSNLYVLPSFSATEPTTPEVKSTGVAGFVVQKIGIRQNSGGPTGTIDGVRVAKTWADLMVNVVTTTIEGEKTNEEAYYQYAANKWAPAQNIYVVTANDYQSMGTATGQPGKNNYFISAIQSEGYLPTLLAKQYPYAQNGNKQIVAYKYNAGGVKTGVDEYIFQAGKWSKPSSIISKSEQFVFSNIGWVFDPTINLALVRVSGNNPYIMKFIDYIRVNTPDKFYQKGTYINEEHYYGFSAYYAQITCSADRTAYGDQAIKDLTTDAAKYSLFLDRVKEAMPLFTQLNYPDLKTDVSGIQQYVIITIATYYSSSKSGNLTIKMKCTKSGTGSSPAEYTVESFVEKF